MEDWGQLIAFDPEAVLRPTSLEELKAMLEQVHRDGGRVRVPGSLHSCSELVVTDTLLETRWMPKTIEVDGDTVVATANVSLHAFLEELARHGKSITATGGTDHQTLAGVISTGTTGASPQRSIYELLDWVEVVTLDASGHAVERRLPGTRAVCSLGLLGVITRVQFRLVDERFFDVVMKIVDLDDVLADLDATSARYDFWRINLVPDGEKALLWAATQVPRSASDPEGDYPVDQSEHLLDKLLGIIDRLVGSGPLLTRTLEGIYDGMALFYGSHEYTGPLRTMLPVDRRAPLRVAMAEWSFRPQDVHLVLGECQQYFGEHGWPNIPTEIELSRTDTAWMSPWNWPGLDRIVKFNFMYLTEVCREAGEKELIHAHLRGLWEHLLHVGVPFKAHWGKVNFVDPEFCAARYDLEAFRPHVVPTFMNAYLAERLG